MGGRGSSIDKGKFPYGTEYKTLHRSGNIKFVMKNEGSATAPMETKTKGRVYVTVNDRGELRNITYYDKNNKRYKQIDIAGKPHPVEGVLTLPHTHKGYEHDAKGTYHISPKEAKMIERVRKIWYYKTNNKK